MGREGVGREGAEGGLEVKGRRRGDREARSSPWCFKVRFFMLLVFSGKQAVLTPTEHVVKRERSECSFLVVSHVPCLCLSTSYLLPYSVRISTRVPPEKNSKWTVQVGWRLRDASVVLMSMAPAGTGQ